MKNLGFTVFLIVIAILAGFVGGTLTNSVALPFLVQYQSSDSNDNNDLSVIQPVKLQVVDEDSQIIEAIDRISPTVVSIVATKDLQIIKTNPDLLDDPFGFFEESNSGIQTKREKIGGGTGFIFTEDGLIITNKHVVADGKAKYTVILNNGDEYPAEVVDKDVFNDIAVVRLLPNKEGKKPNNLPVVTFGDSKKIKVGQRVIAVGNALSEFANTVTVGVISAKNRSIIVSDEYGREESFAGLIQTDAAINPGNSGGPLVNLAGEVVGISTAVEVGANGVGFAIPINDITFVIDSVQKVGRIVRPVLGVRYIQLDKKVAEEYFVPGINEGALLIGNALNGDLAVTPNRPADEAGLQENDVIIEINGETVTKENTLSDIISKQDVGDAIKVIYLRNGKQVQTEVVLEEATDKTEE
jgi:serine protease Do